MSASRSRRGRRKVRPGPRVQSVLSAVQLREIAAHLAGRPAVSGDRLVVSDAAVTWLHPRAGGRR